ncbi:MAG: ABC transporter permease [Clostridiales bacterium]|nr:ABC transporter permease [Clostridiales bacterium]
MEDRSIRARKDRASFLLSAPMIVWTLLFVGATILYVIVLSFLKRDPDGYGVIMEFTLENYARVFNADYGRVFLRTLKLGLETTAISVLLGYPFGYLMGKCRPRWRMVLMLLVIVPFWTNALIRVYGWRILLMGNGPINTVLKALGIIEKPLKLLNTHGAVLLGMVYSLLPFMILPVYTAVEKMDWNMVDAGRDLGAHPAKVFLTVTLPMTAPGLMTGCVLVFIPSLALFFMSDLLGGPNDVLIGNIVNDQLLKSQDWPFAAALAVALLAVTWLIMTLHRRAGGKSTDMTLF